MARVHLTEITVRSLKPSMRQVTYWDNSLRGFGVRVTARGTKTWTVMHGMARDRITVGRWPDTTLAEARAEAKKLLAYRPTHRAARLTFSEALELFLTAHCDVKNRPVTKQGTEYLLRRHFETKFGTTTLDKIKTQNVTAILDALLITPSAATHAFTAARTFFRWCVRRTYIEHSPCSSLQAPARYVPRVRVLTDEELRKVFSQAKLEGNFGVIVQLLILTGQRRGEIASLRSEYRDESTMVLPATITKNHLQHSFPLGPMAADLLPKRDGFLFPARGRMVLLMAGRNPRNTSTKNARFRSGACTICAGRLQPVSPNLALNRTLLNGFSITGLGRSSPAGLSAPSLRFTIATFTKRNAALPSKCGRRMLLRFWLKRKERFQHARLDAEDSIGRGAASLVLASTPSLSLAALRTRMSLAGCRRLID